ncbi:MAG: hypothetical protein M1828_001355 [Chrysothrix sp. TS-e1954]|nr:MAG: hypothetical protein M1828_001355 [Chrysothrix sp. TS-e1954]
MGLPIIGLVVKLVGGGIGLAQEVRAERAARKERYTNALGASSSPLSPSASRSASVGATKRLDAESSSPARAAAIEPPPPYSEEYVEVGPQQANELIANGNAEPIGTAIHRQSDGKAQVLDSDTSIEEDEREWALDELEDEQLGGSASSPVTNPTSPTNLPSSTTPTTHSNDILETDTNGIPQIYTNSSSTAHTNDSLKTKRGLGGQVTLESFASNVLATCPPPPAKAPRLDQPIILPQRRPGEKGRGFVRAYAPVLSMSGISQETFLSFVKNFHAASSASPVLNVVFYSAGAAGFVPEPFSQLGSAVVQAAAGTAMELHRRKRTNNFLDQMNDGLFKPRGLYAMVMSYVPNATRPIEAESVDLTAMIAKQTDQQGQWKANIRANSGKTFGEPELPQSAPLIFPGVEQAVHTEECSKQSDLKTSKILADYYDRRARAVYAMKHPDSALQLPDHQAPKFASRFSDPNDLGGNSSLLTLVTGGKYDHEKKQRQERREEEQRKVAERRAEDAQRQQDGEKAKRRSMKSRILYLMIVNMPTEHELSRARATMLEAQSRAG